jgi:hypothetical protein
MEIHLPVQVYALADGIVLLMVDNLKEITLFAAAYLLSVRSLGLSATESAGNEPTGAPGVLAAVSAIKGPFK